MQSNIHHRDTETRRREKEKSEITEEREGAETRRKTSKDHTPLSTGLFCRPKVMYRLENRRGLCGELMEVRYVN
jgi:hypothetical protein